MSAKRWHYEINIRLTFDRDQNYEMSHIAEHIEKAFEHYFKLGDHEIERVEFEKTPTVYSTS